MAAATRAATAPGRGCSHVSDLAAAHLSALKHLPARGPSGTAGLGLSVREVRDPVGKAVGRARAGAPIEMIVAVGIRDLLRVTTVSRRWFAMRSVSSAAPPNRMRESSQACVVVASPRQRQPVNGALPPATPAF